MRLCIRNFTLCLSEGNFEYERPLDRVGPRKLHISEKKMNAFLLSLYKHKQGPLKKDYVVFLQ